MRRRSKSEDSGLGRVHAGIISGTILANTTELDRGKRREMFGVVFLLQHAKGVSSITGEIRWDEKAGLAMQAHGDCGQANWRFSWNVGAILNSTYSIWLAPYLTSHC